MHWIHLRASTAGPLNMNLCRAGGKNTSVYELNEFGAVGAPLFKKINKMQSWRLNYFCNSPYHREAPDSLDYFFSNLSVIKICLAILL
jgi:hypothetical protein